MVTNKSKSVKREESALLVGTRVRVCVCVPVPEIVLMAAVSFYLMGDGGGAGERRRDDRVSTGKKRRVRKRR